MSHVVPRCELPDGWVPALNPIEALADEAADWIAQRMNERTSSVLSLPGAKGRHPTRQDLRHHVEFLAAAVDVAAPVYFTDYSLWLAGVLQARGAPVQSLTESLRLLKEFFEPRLPLELFGAARQCLDAALAALNAPADAVKTAAPRYQPRMPDPCAQACAFARCLAAGDSAAARTIMIDKAGEGHGYVEIATHLFQPALYAIGRMWERNEITVAEEHLATAIAQTLLVELFLDNPFQPPHGGTVLLAGIEHNQHVIGLRILADAYELAGWSVQYLGANTPTPALLTQIDKFKPDVVGLSVSMVQQLPALRHCVAALRGDFGGRRPVILVGGIPINQFEGVWRHLGADGWSPDAESAIGLTS